MKHKTKLTSVKLIDDVYRKFKANSAINDFTLQKLVNRAIKLYITDEQFKDIIHNYSELTVSGSKF